MTMRVFLLHPEQSVDPEQALPPHSADLIQDLGLSVVLDAMAQEDAYIRDVVTRVLLTPLTNPAVIRYRQAIAQDVLRYPDVLRALYRIPVEFQARKRQYWLWIGSRHSRPGLLLSSARQLLSASLDLLRELRHLADRHAATFQSPGFRRFFARLQEELNDAYLEEVAAHVRALKFPHGVMLRARLGQANQGTDYVLCKPQVAWGSWLRRLLPTGPRAYTYTLHPRDEHGARVLGDLRDVGLARVAVAVAHAAEHVEGFLNVLRWELAFYLGVLHLHEQLATLDMPVAFPEPAAPEARRFTAHDLYDASLALAMGKSVVANDVHADGREEVLISGPNRGGKTTFLRSVGLAYLMMQAGMFVPARALTASVATGLFTHFKREEDRALESGKFEEELKRMSAIVDHLQPYGVVLMNESFGSTNEREGSEVAYHVLCALREAHVRVFYVTHLYELARRLYTEGGKRVLFLRAERLPDSRRTFRIQEGAPEATTHAGDVYRRVFGTPLSALPEHA